jgi:hypothetical protein
VDKKPVRRVRERIREGRRASTWDKAVPGLVALIVVCAVTQWYGMAHNEPSRFYLYAYLTFAVAFLLRMVFWW